MSANEFIFTLHPEKITGLNRPVLVASRKSLQVKDYGDFCEYFDGYVEDFWGNSFIEIEGKKSKIIAKLGELNVTQLNIIFKALQKVRNAELNDYEDVEIDVDSPLTIHELFLYAYGDKVNTDWLFEQERKRIIALMIKFKKLEVIMYRAEKLDDKANEIEAFIADVLKGRY